MKPIDLWSNNTVQFIRLLAEIKMAGIGNVTLQLIKKSMNLDTDQICELLDRAEEHWDTIKEKGYVYKTQIRWGDAPITFGEDKDHRPVTEHTFYSLEELNAFNEAVSAGEGWFSGEQVIECTKHDEHFYPADEDCNFCHEEEEEVD